MFNTLMLDEENVHMLICMGFSKEKVNRMDICVSLFYFHYLHFYRSVDTEIDNRHVINRNRSLFLYLFNELANPVVESWQVVICKDVQQAGDPGRR